MILAIISSLFLTFAHAKVDKDCWITQDDNSTVFVECNRVGPVPSNYKRICPVASGERDASVYKMELVERRFLLPDKRTAYKIGDPKSPNEIIDCVVDDVKKKAKEDAEAAKKAAEDKAKSDKDKEWSDACKTATSLVEVYLCKYGTR